MRTRTPRTAFRTATRRRGCRTCSRSSSRSPPSPRSRSPRPPPPSRSRSAPAPDPVEDVPFLVTATGVGVKDYNVYATIKPVGAVGCGTTLRHRPRRRQLHVRPGRRGRLHASPTPPAVANPGPYLDLRLAAGVLGRRGRRRHDERDRQRPLRPGDARHHRPDAPAASAPPRTSPSPARPRSSRQVVRQGQARRRPPVRLLQQRRRGRHRDRTATTSRATTPRSRRRDSYQVDERGTYRLCAWIQESSGDTAPEAAATYTFTVGTPGALLDRPQPRHQRPPRRPLGQALRHPREAAQSPPRALPRPPRRPPRLLTRDAPAKAAPRAPNDPLPSTA